MINDTKKIVFGQFFTKDSVWLKPQIIDFIKNTNSRVIYDPFAGEGHILNTCSNTFDFEEKIGLDIDSSLGWIKNDSLISIPHVDNAIIITNPPYLANYSASRKKILEKSYMYFNSSIYDDLYLIALDKMLDAQKSVVAIIPETFINSNYKRKSLLHSLTILEENPFDDTDTPVIVACFDGVEKSFDKILVYKNETYINDLAQIENSRLKPNNSIKMIFNDKNGWLAVRCVDTTQSNNMIQFNFKENIDYKWETGIKISSRLLTLISIDVPESWREEFIDNCNKILQDLREKTSDVILSPFKGNMKNGRRRRRLDFITCRAIIEKSYELTLKGKHFMTNNEYYEYCKQNDEELFDKYYKRSKLIIPESNNEENTLTQNHKKLVELISKFSTLHYENNKDENDDEVKQVISEIINILETTPNVNYTPFVQYFMVFRSSFSLFLNLTEENKFQYIFEILKNYCLERHPIYLLHGYTNAILQAICDNYSHKGNSKAGIEKALKILEPYNLTRIRKIENINDDDIYFLPDKGDSKLFEEFLQVKNIEMKSREIEHEKRPDIVFKHNNHFYICELKTMNESGGGQNKQVVEFANFINFSEQDATIHYITFLDGHYVNLLFTNNSPKVTAQRNSVETALNNNPQNYFLNTKGFIKFLENIFQ